jgi:hypothetical protein
MSGEDTADLEVLVLSVVNYRVCELVIELQFFVVTNRKFSVNQITYPNRSVVTHTGNNIFIYKHIFKYIYI